MSGATVHIDLGRVRENAEAIVRRVGVAVLAVVKADAYGLGAAKVGDAIAPVVAGFCTFSLREVIESSLYLLGRPTLTLGPVGDDETPELFIQHNARPAVWDARTATRLRDARPVAALDTGMQRFSCPRDAFDAVLKAGRCDEAFTHATTVAQARQLRDVCAGRNLRLHAAASSLLDEPDARLDAVRPGLALYRGAARVSAPLVVARDTTGPAGYGGFETATGRHGVILVGYRNGLRPGGPCLVNGKRRRVIEVGMQSAFIEIGPKDRVGNEAVLLGDSLDEHTIADAWGTSPQEVLLRMSGIGERVYCV